MGEKPQPVHLVPETARGVRASCMSQSAQAPHRQITDAIRRDEDLLFAERGYHGDRTLQDDASTLFSFMGWLEPSLPPYCAQICVEG